MTGGSARDFISIPPNTAPENALIVSGIGTNQIMMYDTSDFSNTFVLPDADDTPNKLLVTPDRSRMFSMNDTGNAADEDTISVWDIDDNLTFTRSADPAVYETVGATARDIAFDLTNNGISYLYPNASVFTYDIDTLVNTTIPTLVEFNALSIAWAPDGSRSIVTYNGGSTLISFDATGTAEPAPDPALPFSGRSWVSKFSPDGQIIALGINSPPWLYFYDNTDTDSLVNGFAADVNPPSEIRRIEFSPDGNYICASTNSGIGFSGLNLYSVGSIGTVTKLADPVGENFTNSIRGFVWSNDSTRLYVLTSISDIFVYDTTNVPFTEIDKLTTSDELSDFTDITRITIL